MDSARVSSLLNAGIFSLPTKTSLTNTISSDEIFSGKGRIVISLNCCGLLLTDGDQFCSSCGRRSGRLADLAPQVIDLSPSETEWNLPLRNNGPGTLPYRIEVSTPHIEVIGMPSGEILGGNNQSIRLRLVPDAPPCYCRGHNLDTRRRTPILVDQR